MFNISSGIPGLLIEHIAVDMIQNGHILLISDDQQKANDLHNVLTQYHPEVILKIVEEFQQSDIAFGKRLPGLIVLLLTASGNSHMTWLKKIRVAKKLNEIPVFVYNGTPGKTEMQELLSELQR
jgi:DNA-binding response OmpR family regulator